MSEILPNEDRKRMYADERLAMMNLSVSMDSMSAALKPLEHRLKTLKAWSKAKGALGITSKVFEELCLSTPVDQLLTMRRNMEMQTWETHIKSPMGHKPLLDEGLWMPLEALDEMITATKDHCMMCTKTIEQRRKCKLAKSLDLMPVATDEDESNGCRYFNGLE